MNRLINKMDKTEETMRILNELLEKKIRERTMELTQSLERERDSNELKSRFVTMASHEFRTPLSTVLSSLSLLELYIKPVPHGKEAKHFKRIRSSVNQLVEILNDFLSLDRLENGKLALENSAFNLKDFGHEVVDEINGLLKKGQYISYTYMGEVNVYQDRKILRNMCYNLLSNAIKFSEEDKKIMMDILVEDEKIQIAVADEGMGIPEIDQKYMFSRFFRAKNAINTPGTGLGLSIIKRYIELMNGTIDFTSKPGEGTIFQVELPLRANGTSI